MSKKYRDSALRAELTPDERHQLDELGYLTLEELIPIDRVRSIKTRLEELAAETEQTHAGTLIVGGLLEDEVFDVAWSHRKILDAVAHVLAGDHRLTGVSSRGMNPGHGQQSLHVDWGGQGTPGVWYGCHAICAVVDFTPNNGATRVIPGSHRNPSLVNRRADQRHPHPLQRQLIGPAGTVFVLNIHAFHSAMQNNSDEPRLAIFSHFTRRDSPLLLMGDVPEEPSAQALARHPQEIQRLLMKTSP